MLILGIETTCDETSASIVRKRPDGGGDILANEIMSQIAQHAAYGGVVPEIAARAHIDYLDPLIRRALAAAEIAPAQLDGVAAAAGPGLIGGVMVGLSAGKALAWALDKPFVAVNHLEAHALTARMTDALPFPYLVLLVSGGHTQILEAREVGDYRRLGATIDDAIGEAFDKVGKMLGLAYPGGPHVEQAARDGDPARFAFPRPMLGRLNADFSLSGLKTAVRNEVARRLPLSAQDVADLAASFQAAIVDVVVDRVRMALRLARQSGAPPSAMVAAGGVAANNAVRRALQRFCAETGLRLALPPALLCGDNGAMIAWAGIERLSRGLSDGLDAQARPRWPLDAAPGVRHHGKA